MLEIFFESYGCTANKNSTEIMKGLVREAGLNITLNPNFADLIVINSCIVKSPTQEKIRRRVIDFLEQKKKVILAGCMPRLNQKNLQKPNLFLLDTSHVKNLLNLIQDIVNKNYDSEKYLKLRKEVKANLPKISSEKKIGITQISEGCLGACTYCIVRLAKGKLFSYPQEDIINSVKKDLEAGCKEIWITSQDNAAYENEQGRYSLPKLLKKILNLKGKFFIRIGMMNPNNIKKILPELIELYKHPKMFKFLHIPIQSGSNKILKAMNRFYTKEDVLKIIKEFKKQIPNITISTDIIVGFPGETNKDFQETLNIIKKIKPEILNRSNFGPRPGTPAANLKEISPETMKKRATELMNLHLKICKENQKPWIGKKVKVLIDKKGFENTWLGRAENYKLFAVHSKQNILGKFVNV
ncbi:tRNA (N(6)-L-threonylcarbamoyladenosine(37)-C(2))-methylthiotransferase, partial [Candidatus Woesearchaeota archaeon]|nr:tRNA (N(6)-L-threonylcarbamoyladenosine(37)-C(2))-methylthiotransferase [Candidatus Woesearchaeota archaeon]